MTNLLSTVQSVLSGNTMGKIASLIGTNSASAQAAVGSMLPSLLKGIISKGSTTAGAGDLLGMIKNHGLGSGTVDNLSSSLGNGNSSDLLDKGAKLNSAIFGDKAGQMASAPGMDAGKSSKLMNVITPVLMGSLGKVVQKENLDAKGLQSYLEDQKMKVVGGATASAAGHTGRAAVTPTKSGGGLLKWLIPLFLLLAAAWFFLQGKNEAAAAKTAETTTTKATDVAKTATKATHTHTHADGTVHSGASHGDATGTGDIVTDAKNAANAVVDKATDTAGSAMGGLSLDDDGNLLRDGKIYLKKGEFSVKDGEYFDKDGKSLGLLGKVGKVIGDAGKAVGGAVAGAAGKTADAFKDVFGGMFKKKKSGGTVANYTLSKIVFDPTSNRITDFSKNEVQGLAAALKATPDAKIKVQVSSADGADKKITKERAKVVHDMLVTLGVSDKQISAEGLGEGSGSVDIVVE